jgi:pimeloyl-ACP methyl ester carboxylesterase
MPDIEKVTSQDGTSIGFERMGQGPAVVLVGGGSTNRFANAALAAHLAPEFTVLNYDRRGRGDSGDTLPYEVEREIEDLAAVIDAAGGRAFVYGTSSGAALALHGAARLSTKVAKLALWEPPYISDPALRPPADQVEQYNKMISEGRRGDAVEYFMAKVVGLPADFVANARQMAFWAGQESVAHTLAYDATIMGDYVPPVDLAKTVTAPTLLLCGDASPSFMCETAHLLADALPNGEWRTLHEQEHNVDQGLLADAIADFFAV